jgi:hypothetical protein
MSEKIKKVLKSGFILFWNIFVVLVLALIWVFSEGTVRLPIGLLLFFLPGYSLTKFLFLYQKRDSVDFMIYTAIISFALMPLLGNLIQALTWFSSYTLLLTLLIFSVPLLVFSDLRSRRSKRDQKVTDVKNNHRPFRKAFALLGAVAIGLGLYALPSIGALAPRGWDIFVHMNTVNRMISTGETVVVPTVDALSNFYQYLYSSLSLLTGLDVLSTGILGQVMLGGVFMVSIFYLVHSITDSPTASLISAVLFIAGPPLYSNTSPYFYYFHPMYVAAAILPFALACFHEAFSGSNSRELGLSSLLISAVALYHLTVGLMLFFIMIFDFVFSLAKLRKKALVLNFSAVCIAAFGLSSILTIPFLLNITNPFRYVYPQGGLQTLYTMFFGLSGLALSPTVNPNLLGRVLGEFAAKTALPLFLGLPGLLYLWLKKRSSFILIFSCLLTGLLGVVQPIIGVAFMPGRFLEVLILFVSVLVGATLLSLKFYLEALTRVLRKRGVGTKTRFRMPHMPTVSHPKAVVLMLTIVFYVLSYSFIVFYSPARDAMLNADLEIKEDDVISMKEIDGILPKDSKVLMDQYLQVFFTGITGRNRFYSFSSSINYWDQWSLSPLDVYLGRADPSSLDVDYVVISPWCYTTSKFVGKYFFDQNENLTMIYEHVVEKGSAAYSGTYAVYKVKG